MPIPKQRLKEMVAMGARVLRVECNSPFTAVHIAFLDMRTPQFHIYEAIGCAKWNPNDAGALPPDHQYHQYDPELGRKIAFGRAVKLVVNQILLCQGQLSSCEPS